MIREQTETNWHTKRLSQSEICQCVLFLNVSLNDAHKNTRLDCTNNKTRSQNFFVWLWIISYSLWPRRSTKYGRHARYSDTKYKRRLLFVMLQPSPPPKLQFTKISEIVRTLLPPKVKFTKIFVTIRPNILAWGETVWESSKRTVFDAIWIRKHHFTKNFACSEQLSMSILNFAADRCSLHPFNVSHVWTFFEHVLQHHACVFSVFHTVLLTIFKNKLCCVFLVHDYFRHCRTWRIVF